jgi:hypothetical protein
MEQDHREALPHRGTVRDETGPTDIDEEPETSLDLGAA